MKLTPHFYYFILDNYLLMLYRVRTYMQVRKQQLELDMEQQIGSKKEKG